MVAREGERKEVQVELLDHTHLFCEVNYTVCGGH